MARIMVFININSAMVLITSLPHKFHYICFIFLAVAMSGCQLAPQTPVSSTPARLPAQASSKVSPAAEPALDPQTQYITALLQAGHDALRSRRLTTPDDDNAYLRYSQVLNLEPDNSAALLGMSEIVEAYLDLAIAEAAMGRLRAARDFVNKAYSVDPNHNGIAGIAGMIAEQQHSYMTEYLLPNLHFESLAARNRARAAVDPDASGSAELRLNIEILDTVARHIEKANASIIIRANSDALGRQIYQYLNQMTAKRIRAQFEISDQTAVRLYVP